MVFCWIRKRERAENENIRQEKPQKSTVVAASGCLSCWSAAVAEQDVGLVFPRIPCEFGSLLSLDEEKEESGVVWCAGSGSGRCCLVRRRGDGGMEFGWQ